MAVATTILKKIIYKDINVDYILRNWHVILMINTQFEENINEYSGI